MKKILILGASGLLGSSLTRYLLTLGLNVITVSHKNLATDHQIDAIEGDDLELLVQALQPDLVINLVAMTDVNWCETHVLEAYKAHVSLCTRLNLLGKQLNFKILQVSTDHFYDQEDSTESLLQPHNVYALTKLLGEKELDHDINITIRTNFFGKSLVGSRRSLTDEMFLKANQDIEVKLFNDVFFSPLSIDSLCFYIGIIIQDWKPGIYNLGSKSGLSKQDFILTFLEECGVNNIKYQSVSIDSLELSVKRPKDMRMNSCFFESTFSVELPTLFEEIKSSVRQYK